MNHRDGVFDSVLMNRGKDNTKHTTYDKVGNITLYQGTGNLIHDTKPCNNIEKKPESRLTTINFVVHLSL